MTFKRVAAAVAALAAVAVVVFAFTVGPWFWGTDWHVYGDESRRTTASQEAAAMHCAPLVSSVSVLDSFPAEIDIHIRGSADRAKSVEDCLRRSPGIVDAGAVKSG